MEGFFPKGAESGWFAGCCGGRNFGVRPSLASPNTNYYHIVFFYYFFKIFVNFFKKRFVG